MLLPTVASDILRTFKFRGCLLIIPQTLCMQFPPPHDLPLPATLPTTCSVILVPWFIARQIVGTCGF